MGWEMTASGYAAVWATENTREAIFDAMQRRETYGTTGPRMFVRFFGGWDFTSEDANTRLPANVGYAKGVPRNTCLVSWRNGFGLIYESCPLTTPLPKPTAEFVSNWNALERRWPSPTFASVRSHWLKTSPW